MILVLKSCLQLTIQFKKWVCNNVCNKHYSSHYEAGLILPIYMGPIVHLVYFSRVSIQNFCRVRIRPFAQIANERSAGPGERACQETQEKIKIKRYHSMILAQHDRASTGWFIKNLVLMLEMIQVIARDSIFGLHTVIRSGLSRIVSKLDFLYQIQFL